MTNTPHISLRVAPDKLERWKGHCGEVDVDVSFQIRRLMDAWCMARELDQEYKDLTKTEMPDLDSII